jgi:hypothetical protein
MQNASGSMNNAIIAALIAASVSFLAAIVSLTSAVWQRKVAREKVEVDIRSLRWTQHAQAYPKVWSVVQKNTSDWRTERKEINAKWARDFLVQLNGCHADWGVLFSQPVYKKFCEFRDTLIGIVDKPHPSEEDLISLDLIWSGYKDPRGHVILGLATLLKEELDSYESMGWPNA